MNITNIGHASFNVRQMDAMKAFYGDILGMHNLFGTTCGELAESARQRFGDHPSPEERAVLDAMEANRDKRYIEYFKFAERQYIEFFDTPGAQAFPGSRGDYYGYLKMNFEVDDIEALRGHLLRCGVALVRDGYTSVDGSREIAVLDPDGNEVQFTEYSANAREKMGISAPAPAAYAGSRVRCTTQVTFFVRAEEEMRRFYRDGLGLRLARSITFAELAAAKGVTPPGARPELPWLEFFEVRPHQYIELLYVYGEEKQTCRELPRFGGYQHLCLEVEDIHKAREAALANGLQPDTPVSRGGDRSLQFWLTDPDGNRIELMQYTPESKQLL